MLCLDPGETTGYAIFNKGEFVRAGDFPVTSPLLFDELIQTNEPDMLVVENYKVYAHRASQHIGSEVPTIQYVGTLKYLSAAYNIPIVLQMAFQAKGWVTDRRLHEFGYWHESKHARDAIRHGVYFLLFGK